MPFTFVLDRMSPADRTAPRVGGGHGATGTEPGDLLRSLVHAEASSWEVIDQDPWTYAMPDLQQAQPIQGWKLHVSATTASVPHVVAACVPVLVAAGCPFKIASRISDVRRLTGRHIDRAQAGKILTAYPPNDAATVTIGRALHEATVGLRGPRVLSDRQLSPGSLVSYRFGAYRGERAVSLDGDMLSMLRAPDGSLELDRREGRFTPPGWVTDPFRPAGQTADGPRDVLLHNRYRVHQAIRHAHRGGVFRATDLATGATVIVKQGRRDCCLDAQGRDAADQLRHEAAMLTELAGSGWVPLIVDAFEQDGDAFVVEQELTGLTLGQWIDAGVEQGRLVRPLAATVGLISALARIVRDSHERGVVIGDLSPTNIIVSDAGGPRLVDLEACHRPGGPAGAGVGTPGYCAPEFRLTGPGPAADVYALGALAAYACTGEDPAVAIGSRSVADWLRGSRSRWLPVELTAAMSAMCRSDPVDRPSSAAVLELFAGLRVDHPQPTRTQLTRALSAPGDRLAGASLDRAIEALTGRLLCDVHPDRRHPLENSAIGRTTLPVNVQHGTAGVLGVLSRLVLATDEEPVRRLTRRLATRTVDTVKAIDTGPIGLHFGRAGTYWSLFEAGTALGDPALIETATTGARSLPRRWPLLDVTHGSSGLALTLLHLSRHTGDRSLLEAAVDICGDLADRVQYDRFGPFWRVEPGIPSRFAGARFDGFAHGLAGIATTLLLVGRQAGEAEFLALADAAVAAVLKSAVTSDGCDRWAAHADAPAAPTAFWCNGTAGMLILLSRAAGTHPQVLPSLRRGALSLVVDRRRMGIAHCHGLAGAIEAMLDIAAADPDSSAVWRRRAGEVAAAAWERRIVDGDRVALGEGPMGAVAEYGLGYPGVLAALLRLRDGGERLWLPDFSC